VWSKKIQPRRFLKWTSPRFVGAGFGLSDLLELGRGFVAQSGVFSLTVVKYFDVLEETLSNHVAGRVSFVVDQFLLQGRKERFHRGVVRVLHAGTAQMFPASRTCPSSPSYAGLAFTSTGGGVASRAMRSRISANKLRVTATSASWNVWQPRGVGDGPPGAGNRSVQPVWRGVTCQTACRMLHFGGGFSNISVDMFQTNDAPNRDHPLGGGLALVKHVLGLKMTMGTTTPMYHKAPYGIAGVLGRTGWRACDRRRPVRRCGGDGESTAGGREGLR